MTDIAGFARLAANPELKFVREEKKPVCELRVRFLNPRKSKDPESESDWADYGFWVTVSLWGACAEPTARMFNKGDRVFIQANLIEKSYPDKENPGQMKSAMQADSNFVAPYTPDLESLVYKPRNTRQQENAAEPVPAGMEEAAS